MEAVRDGRLPPPRRRHAARGSASSRLPTPASARRCGTAAVALGVAAATLLTLGVIGAVFRSTATGPSSTLTAASLNAYLPTAVTASRTAATTCLVSWTPAGGAPGSLTYDVTDGTSTVATAQTGTSASVTVAATAVTPTVKARLGSWLSSSATAASAACNGFPDAPGGLTLTPSHAQLTAGWTAPAGNGGTVASYTATISPAPATGSATCSPTAPTVTCTWTTLTDGLTYTVSVTATSNVGTGPAATGTAVPYPSTVMSGSNLALWLDGADASTMFAGSGCSGAAAATTVGCWKDRSTTGNDAVQATAGSRPALATVAGRPVPSFDGSVSHLSLTPSLLPNGTNPSTEFLVGSLADSNPAATGYRTAFSWGTAAADQTRTVGKFNAAATAFFDTRFGGASYPGSWPSGSPAVLVAEAASAQTRSAMSGAGFTAPTAVSFSTGTTFAHLGQNTGGTSLWYGQIPEVIVLRSTLTAAETRSLEEYLARKWGTAMTPQAPTGLAGGTTTAAATSAALTWTAPAWNGGSAVTSSTVTATPTAGGGAVTCTATAPATGCTLTGLAGGGAQYSVVVTASNAAGTGPASTAYTLFAGVPSAANAKLWLAADDLDGDGAQEASGEAGLVSAAVQTWKDKSGGGFDVTAPSGSERPGYASRTVNGLAVPTFDGTTVVKGTGTSPYGITGDRSLFVVTRERSFDAGQAGTSSSGGYVVDRAAADNPLFALKGCSGSWGLQYRHDGTSTAACVSAGTAPSANRVDVVVGFRSGTSVSAWVSGAPGSTATEASTITQRALAVGRHGTTTTTGHDVDVAEVLLYDSALSGSNRRAVETYLATKWGGSLAPYVPTGVSATGTGASGAAFVTWTAPTDIGGSALTQYTARTTSGGFSCSATPPSTSCTMTGLTNGTSYTVYLEATNAVGTGDRSATTTVTPATAPGAPTGVAATTGDTTSSVSWTAPASDGGSAITSYTATGVPSDGSLPTRTCTAASSPCSLTSLTDGVTYTVSATATNAVGTGTASSSTTVIPYPSGVMSSSALKLWLDGAESTSIYASNSCSGVAATTTVGCWADRSTSGNNFSQSTGGNQPTLSTVNNHGVPGFDGSNDRLAGSASLLPNGSSTSSMFVVAKLTDSTPTSSSYRTVFEHGTTSSGQSRLIEKLNSSASVTAESWGSYLSDGTWGGAAQVVGAQWSSGVMTLWNSGRPAVTSSPTINTGTTFATVGSENGSYFWMGPIPEVIVLNTAPSAAQRREVEEYLARKWASTITPQAPTSVTGTAGNGQVAVSWTAPTWNGGAAVTGYTVTSSPGGLTCTTASTSCTVTGLTNGTAYTFTVTATNGIGVGQVSAASGSVTPAGPPGAPTGVTTWPGDTAAWVAWAAPASNGGSAITSYTVSATPSSGPTVTCSASSSPCQLTGLTNGTAYTVTVTATNAAGTSAASSPETITPGAAQSLYLWGAGASNSTTPVQTGSTGSQWRQVSTSGDADFTTCGVRIDGTLWCWGDNSNGQLGDASTTDRTNPTQAGSGTTWAQVEVGGNHTCAVRLDGTLWCWGLNDVGQLGDGTTTQRTSPTQVGSGTTWAAVAAGSDHACALRYDGTLWCWGDNGNGRLGDGTTTERHSPTQVGSATTWGMVQLGGDHSCATRSDGTAWCWGANANGQLGDGSTTDRSSPTQAGSATTWSTVRGGYRHTCGTRTDGTLWCWGLNSSGQLGDGSTTQRTAPVQLGSVTTWTGVDAGTTHTCAVRSSGTAWCWGGNTNGQLGDGTSTQRTSPVQVGTATGWAAASAGYATSAALLVPGAPDPPTGLAATAGDTASAVSWTAPSWQNGSAVTSYTATGVPSDGTLPTRTCTAASSPCSLTGLTNGVTYTVSATATNAIGTGSASASTTVIPYPSGVMSSSSVKVWLDARESSTLSAATNCSGSNASTGTGIGCWKNRATTGWNAVAGTTKAVLTASAINGYQAIRFVRTNPDRYAITSAGIGAVGSADRSMFAVATGRTTADNSTNQDGVIAMWPGYHGGIHFQGYPSVTTAGSYGYRSDAAAGIGGSQSVTGAAVLSAVSVTAGGTLGQDMAVNAQPPTGSTVAGSSWYAYADNLRIGAMTDTITSYTYPLDGDVGELVILNTSVTTGQRREVEEYLARKWATTITPQGPNGVSATAASSTSATVSWTASTWNGGASVTGYTATAYPGGATCTTSGTSCTITGLTAGWAYTLSVTATNSAGVGPASATAPVDLAASTTMRWIGEGQFGKGGINPTISQATFTQETLVSTGWATAAGSTSQGQQHSCAVRTAGTLWCWGYNGNGQLGDGTTTSRSTPTQVGSGTTWATVSAGEAYTCATTTDTKLWCWGYNANGQLGDGTTTQRTSPVQITGTTWSKVSAGRAHTCAIKTTQLLSCWGYNLYGEVGDGTTTQRTSPVSVGASTWTSIGTGVGHTCGIRAAGSLWCWGYNAEGEVGDTTTTNRTSPTQVGALTTWSTLGVGSWHACATKSDGTAWCWGANWLGQLGDSTTTNRSAPVQAGSATTWTGVSGGDYHSCGVRTGGTLWCWGYNQQGQLGQPAVYGPTAPTQVGSGTTWALQESGSRHTCATRTDGTLWCAGQNTYGQLGRGSAWADQASTATTIGAGTTWSQLSVGFYSSCAVRADGTAWCWGFNDVGQLGDGTTTSRDTPAQVGAGTSWAQVSANAQSACAIRTDGTLWCWGGNGYSQVGDGTTTNRSSPVQVGSATTWARVAVADSAACATRTDGTLWCWGYNYYGQLGQGDTSTRTVPTQVGTGTSWARVSASLNHTCATRTDGTLWCWGRNDLGQLGDGTTTQRTSPTQIGTATGWALPAAGWYHTCATRTDGTLWCWGDNSQGELGDGTTTQRTSPTQVGALTTWTQPAAGNVYSCALKTANTGWCWGYNGDGRLGDGTTTSRTSPTQLTTPGTMTRLNAGANHTLVLG